MLTIQHIKEGLSFAYVEAVSAGAGTNITSPRRHDYGIDGTFCQVTVYEDRRRESGHKLDFQCKATVDWSLDGHEIVYDLEAKTWNDLTQNNGSTRAVRSILLLLCLPRDATRWLTVTPVEPILRECCYWAYLTGALTDNAETKRIRVPVSQRFTPEALTALLAKVEAGELS